MARNDLFLCTGNSSRSIMAESLLAHWGRGRFRGFSAGTAPNGDIHPITMELLQSVGLPTEDLRCKSWNEFAAADAPQMDFIIAISNHAVGEKPPVWPGHPITADWSLPDPAMVEGSDQERLAAFRETLRILQSRIQLFVSLQHDALDRLSMAAELERIAKAKEHA
jgi:arsenate reductase